MQYICVEWIHDFPDEPTLFLAELDDARWEVRRVEIFRDGTMGYASREASYGSTGLGLAPVPPLSKIAADPVFRPREISKVEFESLWNAAMAKSAGEG